MSMSQQYPGTKEGRQILLLGQSQVPKEEIIPHYSALIVLLRSPEYRISINYNWMEFSRGTTLMRAGALAL